MYADDQTLLASGKTIDVINDRMNNAISPISNWITANSMRINVNKTKYLLVTTTFKLNRLKETNNSLSAYVNGMEILRDNHGKILGVTVDESLSWNEHVDSLCKTIREN